MIKKGWNHLCRSQECPFSFLKRHSRLGGEGLLPDKLLLQVIFMSLKEGRRTYLASLMWLWFSFDIVLDSVILFAKVQIHSWSGSIIPPNTSFLYPLTLSGPGSEIQSQARGGGQKCPPFDFLMWGLWSSWKFKHMITCIQLTRIPNFRTLA